MNKKELIEELSDLTLKEKALKRALDVTYYNNDKRIKNFKELKQIKEQIKVVKYKLRLLKELEK